MSIKNKIPEYILEFFVIILGITVSFLLNEWRQSRINYQAEIAALQSIQNDLLADSLTLSKEKITLQKNQSYFQYFLSNATKAKSNPDSLGNALGGFAMYSTLEVKNIGFQQLKETGQLNIISNKELLTHIIDLYMNQYVIVIEYGYIDRKMVLDEYLPYLMNESPLSLMRINTLKDLQSDKDFRLLVRDKKFQNMFVINMGFKNQQINNYTNLQKSIRQLLDLIKEELVRLQ